MSLQRIKHRLKSGEVKVYTYVPRNYYHLPAGTVPRDPSQAATDARGVEGWLSSVEHAEQDRQASARLQRCDRVPPDRRGLCGVPWGVCRDEGEAAMTQNTSSAVMQQRSEPHDSLDDFPTPPWATRALMEHVIIPQYGLVGRKMVREMRVWEPAANRGHMARPLGKYFDTVIATDVHDYGVPGIKQHDFLMPFAPPSVLLTGVEWTITNPPFRLAAQFIARAHTVKGWRGTAMLVRSAFLEGVDRWSTLFSINPPSIVAQFAERVVMHKGKLTATGSTATAYCWLVWCSEYRGTGTDTRMMWIPPCRRQLEREGDYPGDQNAD
jgi:hypothetical protein